MKKLARGVGAVYHGYSLDHQGGNRNLAAVLYSGIELDPGFMPTNLVPAELKY